MRIWQVMDECIRTGVSTTERTLPGRLGLRRRAPMLYRRLMRGCVHAISCRTILFTDFHHHITSTMTSFKLLPSDIVFGVLFIISRTPVSQHKFSDVSHLNSLILTFDGSFFCIATADRFYPGIASPTLELPAIGPGSGTATDAISGPRNDYEDDDKGVYELNESSSDNENQVLEDIKDRKSPPGAAARKKAALAALKRVPKVVGSINHAIMPMAPVRTRVFSPLLLFPY